MTLENFIEKLECEWDAGGFLGNVRLGDFSAAAASDFLILLKNFRLQEGAVLPRRLVSLLWYLPSFLTWQKERVVEKGTSLSEYEHFITAVQNQLEELLGVP